MRTILILSLLANIFLTIWANTVFVANASQRALSNNAMTSTAGLPSQEQRQY